MIAGITGAVGVAVLVGALVAFLLYRRRQKDATGSQDPGQVTAYDNFKDGMDADEMERSGARARF